MDNNIKINLTRIDSSSVDSCKDLLLNFKNSLVSLINEKDIKTALNLINDTLNPNSQLLNNLTEIFNKVIDYENVIKQKVNYSNLFSELKSNKLDDLVIKHSELASNHKIIQYENSSLKESLRKLYIKYKNLEEEYDLIKKDYTIYKSKLNQYTSQQQTNFTSNTQHNQYSRNMSKYDNIKPYSTNQSNKKEKLSSNTNKGKSLNVSNIKTTPFNETFISMSGTLPNKYKKYLDKSKATKDNASTSRQSKVYDSSNCISTFQNDFKIINNDTSLFNKENALSLLRSINQNKESNNIIYNATTERSEKKEKLYLNQLA